MLERHATEDLVRRLGALAELTPVPMVIADGDGRLLAANQPWRDLGLGRGGADADTDRGPVEHGPADLDRWTGCLEPASRRRLIVAVENCAHNAQPAALDLQAAAPAAPAGLATVDAARSDATPDDRRWHRWWLHRRLIEGEAVVVMVVLDVHDDLLQRDDLVERATRDDLTGLLNRRVFLESLDQALRRADRTGEPAGLLYIDLDGFKEINDQSGHQVGDLLLAAVATRLRQAVRGADVVGRIGGDEFAVILERLASPVEAKFVARRVQQALRPAIPAGGRSWTVSASVGIALTGSADSADDTDSADGTDGTDGTETMAEALLARADQDMYAAKRARSLNADGTP